VLLKRFRKQVAQPRASLDPENLSTGLAARLFTLESWQRPPVAHALVSMPVAGGKSRVSRECDTARTRVRHVEIWQSNPK